MPPVAIAGAAAGAGAIGGAAISSKGAKKAAETQAASAAAQRAQDLGMYNDAVTRYQPDINYGNNAQNLYNGADGNGGDPASAAKALAAFQNSTGYQTTLSNDMGAINSNAYANGLGRSGAALKALQDRGAYDAQQSYGSWMDDLNRTIQTGGNAKAALSGAQTTAVAGSNAATQAAADASSNASLSSASSAAAALGNLGNLAANAYNSSYGNSGGNINNNYAAYGWNSQGGNI
jgi:hypothetical protein